jgi:hypothetical protein
MVLPLAGRAPHLLEVRYTAGSTGFAGSERAAAAGGRSRSSGEAIHTRSGQPGQHAIMEHVGREVDQASAFARATAEEVDQWPN